MSDYVRTQLRIGEPFDAKELAAKFTVDIVSCCIYGFKSNAFSGGDRCEIRDYGGQIFKPSTKVLIYFAVITAFPFLKKFWKVPLCEKRVEDFFNRLMHDAIAIRAQSKLERNDFLDYLLELKQRKSLSDVVRAHTIVYGRWF